MPLLERSDTLDHLRLLLASAEGGTGHLLFLGGEAGVGKTTLLKELIQTTPLARVLWGGCDPLSTPRPLGPLLDLAHEAGAALVEALRTRSPRELVFHALLEDLRSGGAPTLVVLEDLHWADEATFDLARYLGRRVAGLPVLIIGTYRVDEAGPRHPLSRVMGDLATAASVSRRGLEPLSRAAVTTLTLGRGVNAEELYRRTGGNPFFVSELLGGGGLDLPGTVRDAILARSARLSREAQHALHTAAVLGPKAEAGLVQAIAGVSPSALEECEAARLLEPSGTALAFRHELVREALRSSLSASERRTLHAAALEALKDRTDVSLAVKAEHAEGAGHADAVLEYAPAAAREAAALRSHREAVAQYGRALRFAAGSAPELRASLCEERAFECYLTDQIEEAVQCRQTALELRRAEGNPAKVSENLRGLSRLAWFLGRKADADGFAREAISVLVDLPRGRELGMAWSNLSQLCMLEGSDAEAIRYGESALALARSLGDLEIEIHALNNIGTARAQFEMRGDWHELEESLRLALECGLEDHVARALTNLAAGLLSFGQLDLMEHWLEKGLAYTADHDLEAYWLYLCACRAMLELFRGRWDQATQVAREVLQHTSHSPVNRVLALVVISLIQARRGDGDPWPGLDEALALAAPIAEMQRLAVVRLARVEAAWLAGEAPVALRELEAFSAEDKARCDGWQFGNYAYWHGVTGSPLQPAREAAAPWAALLRGEAQEAARIFRDLGLPYETAQALMASENPRAWREAHELFLQLGAHAVAAESGRRLRAAGIRDIPRVPRASTRSHKAGLTLREREVLELLAKGLRNTDIATRLFVSSRTVDHHVSSILGKTGAQSRLEAVAWFHSTTDLPTGPEPLLPGK